MLLRVKYAISYLILNGIVGSQRELSKTLGYNESCFSQMLNEKKPISVKFIERMTSKYAMLNKEWILNGTGEMLKDVAPLSVQDRLIHFIKSEGISKNAFEKACGLSKRYVSNIRQSIQPDKIRKIALAYPHLNTGWLLTGEGEMIKDDIPQSVKDRTLSFIAHKGLSVKKFEEMCGLSNGYVNSMRSGYGGGKLADVLATFPELSMNWLVLGEGEMLKSEVSQSAKGDNTINQSKSTNDAKTIKEMEQRITELLDDKKNLQEMVHTLQSQITKLLEKI